MTTATIGARFQVVIPVDVRKNINLKPHQKIMIERKDDVIVLRPMGGGQSYRGIAKTIRTKEDPVDYISRLRNEWNQRK